MTVMDCSVSWSGKMRFPTVRKIQTAAEMHFLKHNSKFCNKLYKYFTTLFHGEIPGVTRAAEIYCELINGKIMPSRIM